MPPLPSIALPESIPIMVLSQCTLFPHSLLPLFIFEPRYREMLARALDEHRMFAIGYLDAGSTWGAGDESDDRIHRITTCGVVRACVGRLDGTSHLMLQGLQRVRIVEWLQREPFRIARIEPLPLLGAAEEDREDDAQRAEHLLELLGQILPSSGPKMDPLLAQLGEVENLETLMDIVTANFLVDGIQRQEFLELEDLGARWHFLTTRLALLAAK